MRGAAADAGCLHPCCGCLLSTEDSRIDGLTVSVFIVAEICLFRDLLFETLARNGFNVVGTAATGDDALAQLRKLTADIVLLDVRTPEAIGEIQLLLSAGSDLKVLAIAVPELEQEIMRCAEAGIAGYVTEEADFGQLVAAVESVARGETLCTPRIAAALLRRVAALASERGEARPPITLTSRQLEVVSLIEQGLSNKEIARQLSIELSTVKNHVHNILEKLGARRRWEAVAQVRGTELRADTFPPVGAN